jgi:hypothetical protein
MRTPITAVSLMLALAAGCASHPGPIIDTKGVNMARYEIDLRECSEYAEEISVAEGTAKGAAAGAVVGAAAGAISGDADRGAGYGAIGGGTRSALYNQREKERVVKNCLRGRGYRVLN